MHKILLIPMEKADHPHADVRLVPIIPILKTRGEVFGLEFIHNVSFETIKKISLDQIRGYFSLGWYLLRAFFYGLFYIKQVDLIFCEHVYCAIVGASLSLISRKPYIWDSHGNLTAGCEEMGDPKLYSKVLRYLERLAIKRAEMLVVPTKLDRELYISQNLSADRIKVIPCGVDMTAVDSVQQPKDLLRKELGLDQQASILIFIGKRSYLPNKEAAWWINDVLTPAIAERYPGNVQIIITGSGDIPASVHKNVAFVGFVQDIFKYINAADICLVPVHLDNGVSTKLLDFMACAKPTVVLSTVAKGMPEIKDDVDVLLARDLDQFVERVLEALMMQKERLDEIGLNGRKIIEQYYSYNYVKDEWGKLLDKILNRNDE